MHFLSDIWGSRSGAAQYSSGLLQYENRQTAAAFSVEFRISILYEAAKHLFLDSVTLKIKALHSPETSVNNLPIDTAYRPWRSECLYLLVLNISSTRNSVWFYTYAIFPSCIFVTSRTATPVSTSNFKHPVRVFVSDWLQANIAPRIRDVGKNTAGVMF